MITGIKRAGYMTMARILDLLYNMGVDYGNIYFGTTILDKNNVASGLLLGLPRNWLAQPMWASLGLLHPNRQYLQHRAIL